MCHALERTKPLATDAEPLLPAIERATRGVIHGMALNLAADHRAARGDRSQAERRGSLADLRKTLDQGPNPPATPAR